MSIRGLLVIVLSAAGFGVEAGPEPSCGATGAAVVPPYAKLGDPPTVRIWRDVELAPDAATDADRTGEVQLKRVGMSLDLGGIAKVYSAQQVLQRLGEAGVSRALVRLGGDLAASDPRHYSPATS